MSSFFKSLDNPVLLHVEEIQLVTNDQSNRQPTRGRVLALGISVLILIGIVAVAASRGQRTQSASPSYARNAALTQRQQQSVTEDAGRVQPIAGTEVRINDKAAAQTASQTVSQASQPASKTAAPGGAKIPSQAPAQAASQNASPLTSAQEKNAIVDQQGHKITPSAVLQTAGNDIFFLSANALWHLEKADEHLREGANFVVTELKHPARIGTVTVQEFSAFTYNPYRNAIIVLDKSGDLYEFKLTTGKWLLFRSNMPFLPHQPDPHFIDVCAYSTGVALLDPERNQIWKALGNVRVLPGFFPDILPWRVKSGDAILGDAGCIASDRNVYVIRRNGALTIYGDGNAINSPQQPFVYAKPKGGYGVRPSRLVTREGCPIYIVERDNNRVLAIDKTTHKVSQFIFPATSDLRGLVAVADGFWVINGSLFEHRTLTKPDTKLAVHKRPLDRRLDGMIIPIEGMRLPRHSGVFPGARRLYRYGVHEGLDFFYDAGAKTKVKIGTPVRAAENGKIVRADANYRNMTASEFSRIMSECYRQHRTSDKNEDLFRGCQVWVDHGNHLMTRYAHLSKINMAIKPADFVKAGDLIGFVGISGTGQHLPGRVQFPHLHYEIWMDGHYLGWGLTPTETLQVYEDIFGTN